ncbi:hypothetical protein L0F81_00155 [Streptomyces tricolor]|uniref:BON domain-containing protein n=1 Tax=Streptomyces tricolor TaxID=68277 RepID=A0ABS9J836_9ACTN|nr:hypothetical protein [Streptomyces tricolor]MCG0061711.1 hypothetical protein [Streptomyces tricolor]
MTFDFVAITRSGLVYRGNVEADSAEQGARQAVEHMKANRMEAQEVVIDGYVYSPRI